MATLYNADGSVEENVDISSLRKQQNLVGGDVEYIYTSDKIFIVNEEGHFIHLPYNEEASSIYGHSLVGDVVICESNEINL